MGIISGAVGFAGGIGGSIASGAQMRNIQRRTEKARRANKAWYNRRYNEDSTQRADAQRLLDITEQRLTRNNTGAQARQAVMGGTDAALAAQRQADSDTLANVTSQMAANMDSRKDNIEQQYQANDRALIQQQNAADQAQAANLTQTFNGIGKAAEGASDSDFKTLFGL